MQSTFAITMHYAFTWIICRLLKKRYVRTESPYILIYLQKYFIIFEECTPRTLRSITKWMVHRMIIPLCTRWNHHLILNMETRLSSVTDGSHPNSYRWIVCTNLVSSSMWYSMYSFWDQCNPVVFSTTVL